MSTVLWRTFLLYGALIAAVRLMGKRQLGQMEATEFVVTMLLANLASIPIEETSVPVLFGVGPIALVLIGERLLSTLTLKSIHIRRFLCGKPVLLMENGRINLRNLQRTRINLDELTMHLREKDIFDLREVKYAILETNGQLSILLYSKCRPASAKDAGIRVVESHLPITIISDGRLLRANLQLCGKDPAWVEKELRQRGCKQKEVLLMTLDAAGQIYFVRRSS